MGHSGLMEELDYIKCSSCGFEMLFDDYNQSLGWMIKSWVWICENCARGKRIQYHE